MQYLGMRGICYVELSVETASTDVHSGLGGSIFPNAAWRLVWALASLKDAEENIRIAGFYDGVRPPSARDRELIRALPEVADEYKSRYGVKSFIKGTFGRRKAADRGSVHPHLHDLRTHLRLPGTRLEDGHAGSGFGQSGLSAGAGSGSSRYPARSCGLHLDANGFADVAIADLGGDAPHGLIPMTRSSSW